MKNEKQMLEHLDAISRKTGWVLLTMWLPVIIFFTLIVLLAVFGGIGSAL